MLRGNLMEGQQQTSELEEEEDCSSLESSLTEMDWLSQLNVGGVLATISTSNTESYDEKLIGQNPDENGDSKNETVYSNNRNVGSLTKPPYSYTHLITAAINSTVAKRMTLSEIYQWISENYPYYQNAGYGWKNSIRHNLSLNKHFVKQSRMKDDPGKGSYWALSDQPQSTQNSSKLPQKRSHRPQLTQRQLDQLKVNGAMVIEPSTSPFPSTENHGRFVITDGDSVDLSTVTEADIIEAFRTICKNSTEVFTGGDIEGAVSMREYFLKFCQENFGETHLNQGSFDNSILANANHNDLVGIVAVLSNENASLVSHGDMDHLAILNNNNGEFLSYQPPTPVYNVIAHLSDVGHSLLTGEAYLDYTSAVPESFIATAELSAMQQFAQNYQQLEANSFECDPSTPSFSQMIEGIDLENMAWDTTDDIV